MKKWVIFLALTSAASVSVADIEKEFDGLGGNRVLLEKAQTLNPDAPTSIVQERTVNRRNRWEISPEYSGTFGGDTYVKSQSAGLNVHYHITPRWSLGVKYNRTFNKLTDEGNALIEKALDEYSKDTENPSALIPEIDYPKEEQMAYLNWYPVYGKMNLLDRRVAQFDFYGLLGYGQVRLLSGTQPTYTAGGGLGIWWGPRFSTRVEMRYQNYKHKTFAGDKTVDLAIASMQMGWLL